MLGCLRRCHSATLRIDAGHDVFDGAVFPRGVHPLQDNQQGALVFGIKQIVQRGEFLHVNRKRLRGMAFRDSWVSSAANLLSLNLVVPSTFSLAISIPSYFDRPVLTGPRRLRVEPGAGAALDYRRGVLYRSIGISGNHNPFFGDRTARAKHWLVRNGKVGMGFAGG